MLTVSNELPQRGPDGPDASTIRYEYSFNTPQASPMKKFIPLKEFNTIYHGKEKDNAELLDTESIR